MKNKLLLITIGIVLSAQMLSAQVPSYLPTDGLVGYWPFNNNANDVSGNNNNGSVNGATLTTDRNGNANSAYSFNGSSNYIQIANSISLQNINSITISAWVNINQLYQSGGAGFFPIVSKSNLQSTYGNYAFGFWSPNIIAHLNNAETATSFPFSFGNWQNVVVTIGNGTTTFYLNGDVLWSGNSGVFPNSPVNNLPLIFGMDKPGLVEYANGKIDDIGIWNRVLSSQEIASVYNQIPLYSDSCNNVSGSLTQGLVGYWPFCGNALDDSGHGNNGNVNGATLTTDRFGNSNSAYNFNGSNNWIEVAHNATLDFETTNSISISTWIKTSMTTGAIFVQKQLGVGATQNGVSCGILDSNGYLHGVSKKTNGVQSLISNLATGFNNNSWHHFVYTFSSGNAKIYLDGVLLSSQTDSGSIVANSTSNLIFGYGLPLNNFYYNGTLDDIGIWNRALTPSEVTQLFNQNQCFTNTTVTDTLVINVGQLSYTNPIAYANNITIYPNPASTLVNISFNNITDLTGGNINIINSLGQQVATTPITLSGTSTTMSLDAWGGSGLYFVQILNAQGQILDIKKIILQ